MQLRLGHSVNRVLQSRCCRRSLVRARYRRQHPAEQPRQKGSAGVPEHLHRTYAALGTACHPTFHSTMRACVRQPVPPYPGSQAGIHSCCCWVHSVPGHQPAAGSVPGASGARRLVAGAHRQTSVPPQGLPDIHHHGGSSSMSSTSIAAVITVGSCTLDDTCLRVAAIHSPGDIPDGWSFCGRLVRPGESSVPALHRHACFMFCSVARLCMRPKSEHHANLMVAMSCVADTDRHWRNRGVDRQVGSQQRH